MSRNPGFRDKKKEKCLGIPDAKAKKNRKCLGIRDSEAKSKKYTGIPDTETKIRQRLIVE
jgi:glutaredoxin-related protein